MFGFISSDFEFERCHFFEPPCFLSSLKVVFLGMAKSKSGSGFCLPDSEPKQEFLMPDLDENPDIFHPSPVRVKPGKIWVFGF